ncbi:MAG TPA: tetratricopeptide repeat protein [Chitinophagales bacterium]|nr:tetratricopeptide repeat protein [Chitinophagales bacterium]
MPQPNAEAYYLRGIAKHGLNDKQGAIDDYRKALQLNPQLTDAVTKLTALGATP